MERLPLLLNAPSFEWDRSEPEWVLFEKTLNVGNAEETVDFLTALDEETVEYEQRSCQQSEDWFAEAEKILDSDSDGSLSITLRGLDLLDIIIMRAPRNSHVLKKALKKRGDLRFERGVFQSASNDYEMYIETCKYNESPNEDVSEVYGYLVICMYNMGKLYAAKNYLIVYKRLKAKIPPEMREIPTFSRIEAEIAVFMNEINAVTSEKLTISVAHSQRIPYRGFSTSSEIPGASSICNYQDNGVYATEDVEKASVIFIEHPIAPQWNIPLVNCDFCYRRCRNPFTCLKCRYKPYCSLNCLKRDLASHKSECIGFRQLTLLLLGARGIFRVFEKISNYLHDKVFCSPVFSKLTTAGEVWDELLNIINKAAPNDSLRELTLITTIPLYSNFVRNEYSTLVTTVFRLTLFIESRTKIIENLYKDLDMPNKQKIILVGSLLMRIQGNLNASRINFSIPKTIWEPSMDFDKIGKMLQAVERCQFAVDDIDDHLEVNTQYEEDIKFKYITSKSLNNEPGENALTLLRHNTPCQRTICCLSMYKDKISESYFSNESDQSIIFGENALRPTENVTEKLSISVAGMSTTERHEFVKKCAASFHKYFAEYFMEFFDPTIKIEQSISLYCPTMRKFKHSCDPNVEAIVLNNGTVIGKCLRNVKKGEQLFISHTANYLYHTSLDRQKLLDEMNINCDCKFCEIPVDYDKWIYARLSIKCKDCETIILDGRQTVCPDCDADYNTLFSEYASIINSFENALKSVPTDATIKDKYILHTILTSFCDIHLTLPNEIRISASLRYAHFLAKHNYAQAAYDIVDEVYNNVLRFYEEKQILFTFYSDILYVLKILLYNNLEDDLMVLTVEDMTDACNVAERIVNLQKEYYEFYEMLDLKAAKVESDLQTFFKWKEMITNLEILYLSYVLENMSLNDNEDPNPEPLQ